MPTDKESSWGNTDKQMIFMPGRKTEKTLQECKEKMLMPGSTPIDSGKPSCTRCLADIRRL